MGNQHNNILKMTMALNKPNWNPMANGNGKLGRKTIDAKHFEAKMFVYEADRANRNW